MLLPVVLKTITPVSVAIIKYPLACVSCTGPPVGADVKGTLDTTYKTEHHD